MPVGDQLSVYLELPEGENDTNRPFLLKDAMECSISDVTPGVPQRPAGRPAGVNSPL